MATLSIADVAFFEGNANVGIATVPVTLDEAAATDVTFTLGTSGGSPGFTAVDQNDYRGGQATITIPAGETAASVRVEVLGDTRAEENEAFALVVSNVVGAALADGASTVLATITIVNDDDAAADTGRNVALLRVDSGDVLVRLRPDIAPLHVARITELADAGFYDGLTFHRVLAAATDGIGVAQGGDPLGNGTGGSGQTILAEISAVNQTRGTVAMARSTDFNSADSQFYFNTADNTALNQLYTIWGETIAGLPVIDAFATGTPPSPVPVINSFDVLSVTDVIGTTGADTLSGDAGGQLFISSTGDDNLNGAGGHDWAVFGGSQSNFTVTRTATGFSVTDNLGSEGTNTLSSIEVIKFDDTITEYAARDAASELAILRLYNTDTGRHLMTSNAIERDVLVGQNSGWTEETSVIGAAQATADNTTDLFRFYKSETNSHFYTTSTLERAFVEQNLPAYTYDGISFKVFTETADGLNAVYRLFNTLDNTHFYTGSLDEVNALAVVAPYMLNEGIVFYGDVLGG